MLPTFFADLYHRRVPHVLALYAGASWGFVQFVSFLEERYRFSPHWTDLSLLGLALLLPSVVLITYNHGRPGADAWTRSEKIAVPTNLVVAAVALFATFGGKDLGATTTTLTVTDEHGRQIERVVPKSEFRKRLALFDFDMPPGDSAAWLGHGLPATLAVDLAQDLFVDVRTPWFFRERLREAGYGDGTGVPLPLKRRIAQDLHLEYFVAGEVTTRGGGLSVTISLYETRRGRLVQARTYEARDPFTLVDDASVQLRRDLGLSERHLDEAQDLPVSAILTGSRAALRAFTEGAHAVLVDDDWARAGALLEQATVLQPDFAYAQYMLFRVRLHAGEQAGAMPGLQAAMDHLYRLDERMQHQVKADHYFMRGEHEKVLAVVEMWAELYPHDIQAHQMLAQMHTNRDDKDAAIAALETVLRIDPGQHELLLRIASLQEAKGDFAGARASYELYAERFPNQEAVFVSLGNLFRRTGEHEQAAASYRRALVIEPSSNDAKVRIALLERDRGRFDEAQRLLEEALASARSPEDRARTYGALRHLYEYRGQWRRSVEYRRLWLDELTRTTAPLVVLQSALSSTAGLVHAGRVDEAEALVREAAAQLAPPLDKIYTLGSMQLYHELERAAEMEAAVIGFEQLIADLGQESLRPMAVAARGRLEELRGRCDAALTHYEHELRIDPADALIHARIGRCLHALRQHRRAEQAFLRTLQVHPHHPRTNYELGLLYLDTGNRRKAAEHLERAAAAWADADPDYRRAREARAKLAEVRALARN